MDVATVRMRVGRSRVWRRMFPALVAAILLAAGAGGVPGVDAAVARGGSGLALHGDGGYGVGAQLVPGDQPSIVVIGTGEASAPAKSATMQVIVRAAVAMDPAAAGGGPMPATPPALTDEQIQPVVDALVGAGIAEETIDATVSQGFSGTFGPGTADIRIALAQGELELMPDLLAAVTVPLEGLTVDTVNAAYEVADCAPLVRKARKAAAADARERAEGLADAVGLELGKVLLVGESQAYAGVPGVGCAPPSPGFQAGGKGTYLPVYDPSAPAEVEVYAQLNMAYAIT